MNRFKRETLPSLPSLPSLLLICAFCCAAAGSASEGDEMDKSASHSMDAAGQPLRLLFIHHSCGGQLLAEPGPQVGGETGSGMRCIYRSHPNGGDLRRALTDAGYEVHELSYESELGEETDIRHWRRKFTDHLPRLLTVDMQDRHYRDGRTNDIIAFKSCYPNNDFVGRGDEPGDPDSPQLTVANAKAAYRSLLPVFSSRPDILFVAFTAPPLAEIPPSGVKARLKAMFKPKPSDLAREFNTWLADPQNGWLSEYAGSNVVVFDYYDILTDGGASNWSRFPTGNGRDSHPSAQGNRLAAEAFVPFLDEAVSRMR